MEVDQGDGKSTHQKVNVTQVGASVNFTGEPPLTSKQTYWHIAVIAFEVAGLVGLFLWATLGHAHGY